MDALLTIDLDIAFKSIIVEMSCKELGCCKGYEAAVVIPNHIHIGADVTFDISVDDYKESTVKIYDKMSDFAIELAPRAPLLMSEALAGMD